jgi:hypothetical protein
VTVTASTAGKTATTGTTPTPNQAFVAFLARVQPIRKKSNDMLDRCDRLEQKVNSLDPTFSGWAAAAQCTRREAKLDKQAADTLATIVPPKQLRHLYLAYVRSYRTDGRIESDLSYTLTHRQVFNWNTFNNRYNARSQVVANFRLAVIAYAAQNGFGVPGWVHHIGGK